MIEVEVEAGGWTAAAPDAEALARAAAEAALGHPAPAAQAQASIGVSLVDEGLEFPAAPVPMPFRPAADVRDVTVLLTDDEALRELNRAHRGQDKPTNVLSFPAAPSAAPHLGDVALAYETCAREAAEQGKTLADHLKHLVAHGVLHLLGWDHQTEAEALAMEARERDILADLGTADPYRDRDTPSMADPDSSSSVSNTSRDSAERRRPGLLGFLGRWALGEADAAETPAPVSEAARDLVDQAQAFQSIRVDDVMTPRADVVSVELDATLEEVWKRFSDSEHSRMPIYRETLDDPVGVVHIKDLVKLLSPGPDRSGTDWGDQVLPRLRRDTLYVPASMRAADLLVRMQSTRIHMALVIDEFGGTDGLVTLEDLLEAVVGEIDDEHDVETTPEIVERPGGWEADARAPLEDLEGLAGESLTPEDDEEEIETVGGLVATLAGRVPQRGEVVAHPRGYEFEVIDADPRRIKRVRVRRVARAVQDVADDAA